MASTASIILERMNAAWRPPWGREYENGGGLFVGRRGGYGIKSGSCPGGRAKETKSSLQEKQKGCDGNKPT